MYLFSGNFPPASPPSSSHYERGGSPAPCPFSPTWTASMARTLTVLPHQIKHAAATGDPLRSDETDISEEELIIRYLEQLARQRAKFEVYDLKLYALFPSSITRLYSSCWGRRSSTALHPEIPNCFLRCMASPKASIITTTETNIPDLRRWPSHPCHERPAACLTYLRP
jgi:hypothetical protein